MSTQETSGVAQSDGVSDQSLSLEKRLEEARARRSKALEQRRVSKASKAKGEKVRVTFPQDLAASGLAIDPASVQRKDVLDGPSKVDNVSAPAVDQADDIKVDAAIAALPIPEAPEAKDDEAGPQPALVLAKQMSPLLIAVCASLLGGIVIGAGLVAMRSGTGPEQIALATEAAPEIAVPVERRGVVPFSSNLQFSLPLETGVPESQAQPRSTLARPASPPAKAEIDQRTAAVRDGAFAEIRDAPLRLAAFTKAPARPNGSQAKFAPGLNENTPALFDRSGLPYSEPGYQLMVHAPEELADDEMLNVLTALENAQEVVGDLIRVPFTISANHVRYYHAQDAEVAERIATLIDGTARDFTDFRPQPSEGRVEVWMAGGGDARVSAESVRRSSRPRISTERTSLEAIARREWRKQRAAIQKVLDGL
ncbi:hypothetical protein [Litoreibacter roseus]|uniref:Uncharacterized protein n=1 Tax=Litoreibacter roseus TaxID=2601869 RepID=A0A6N6JIU1_9RHOB|nr:hypothetical protein [Litoreibacter roseus]GFE65339.1 hypothetical protein KIN_24130 [Litoreibacter roseus]